MKSVINCCYSPMIQLTLPLQNVHYWLLNSLQLDMAFMPPCWFDVAEIKIIYVSFSDQRWKVACLAIPEIWMDWCQFECYSKILFPLSIRLMLYRHSFACLRPKKICASNIVKKNRHGERHLFFFYLREFLYMVCHGKINIYCQL